MLLNKVLMLSIRKPNKLISSPENIQDPETRVHHKAHFWLIELHNSYKYALHPETESSQVFQWFIKPYHTFQSDVSTRNKICTPVTKAGFFKHKLCQSEDICQLHLHQNHPRFLETLEAYISFHKCN